MVRSKFVSGVGRVAQCETLESRNLFSVATPDTAFSQDGETLVRFGGTNESAAAGAVLKSGRLLVVGNSYQSDGFRIALAAFNRDGTLSNSFDGDGKLLLPKSVRQTIGGADQVLALPDGNALIVGSTGLAKVLAKGGLDTTFGASKNGVVEPFPGGGEGGSISDASVDSAGNTRVLWMSENYDAIHLTTFTPAGAKVGDRTIGVEAYSVDVSGPQFLEDGSVVFVTRKSDNHYRLLRLDNTLKPVKNFTGSGVDATSALQAYFARHEPTADTTVNSSSKLPNLNGLRFLLNTDGSVSWQSSFFGEAAGVKSEVANSADPLTRIAVNVGLDGKRVSVYGGGITGGSLLLVGVDDRDAGSGVNGQFLTSAGAAIDVSVSGGRAFIQGSTVDTDRSVYVFGRAITTGSDNRDGFVVASVKPPEALATGVLFNDKNADGIVSTETGENTGNGGKTVYVDTNGNNVFDADEYSTVTDASGRYYIGGLAGGEYRIRRVNAAGYQYTTGAQRYNQTQTLVAGVQYDIPIGTINKGVVQGLLYEDAAGQIGPRLANQTVFLDLDKDGKLDANEPSTMTDTNGFYRLVTPSSGTVRVTAVTPSRYKPYGQPKGYSDVYLSSVSLVNVSFSYKKI